MIVIMDRRTAGALATAMVLQLLCCFSHVKAAYVPAPTNVRVEYLSPALHGGLVTLSETRPRFCWEIPAEWSANVRGLNQTAYQVQVHQGPVIMWDSGKVASTDSCHIEYNGSALASDATYTLQVMWWSSQAGGQSLMSDPIEFNIGLLSTADWCKLSLDAHVPFDSCPLYWSSTRGQ